MVQEQAEQQPRSKTVAAAVTPDERRDLTLVALAHKSSESDVLRDMTIADIVAEAARIRKRAGVAAG